MGLTNIIDRLLGEKVKVTVAAISGGKELETLETTTFTPRYDIGMLVSPLPYFTTVRPAVEAKITVKTADCRELSRMYTMPPDVYEQITAMVKSGTKMALTARIKGNELPDNLPAQLYDAY